MTTLRESDLAWDLVEDFRDRLTAAELSEAFVGLGVGDYTPVIHTVLHALARANKPLPPDIELRVQAWMDCYHQHPTGHHPTRYVI